MLFLHLRVKRFLQSLPLAMLCLVSTLSFMAFGSGSFLTLQAACQSDWAYDQNDSTHILYIGVLANRGAEVCLQEWGPTADYLSEHLSPYEFRILPLSFDDILEEVKSPERRIAFVSANSSYYTYMEYHGLASRIATLQIPGKERPETLFGGVIITRHDRTNIQEIRDLRNKTFAAVDERSLGGWHAALKIINDAGMSPERIFSEVIFSGTHDQVVFDVIAGKVDAGTVRTTQLERMVAEGLIDLQDIRIIHDQTHRYPDYPYLLSTHLYPEWPFAVLQGTDKELSKRVSIALLMMEADHPAAIAIRGAGWTIPADYIEVHRMLRSLLLPPYEDYGITLRAAIRNYWPWLAVIFVLFVAAIVFGVIISILRHRTKNFANQIIKTEKKFKTLFEKAPVSIMVHDRNTGLIIDANRQAFVVYGVDSLKELQEMNFWGEPPFSYDEVLEHTRLVQQQGSHQFEWRTRSKNGNYFWEDVTVQEVEFGDEIRHVSISKNITDRKEAETKLRESEEIFRRLSENLTVGVAMINQKMDVVTVNPQMKKWFPDGKYKSSPKCYQAFNYPKIDGVCFNCPVAKTLQDGETHSLEREVNTRFGTRYLAVTATAIKDDHGKITAAIEMVDDITDRKHSELLLREAKQEADAANKAKSEFLANMSHEIRTPLNGVIGFTDLLMNTKLSETQHLYAQNAYTSAHSLLGIINDILDLSKIEANKLELEIIKTDIFELSGEAIDIIKFHAAKKGLELLLNIQPDMPRYIKTDPVRLKQILVNLLSNAVKFTQKGEVELKLAFKDIDGKKGEFKYSVSDTGIGISEANQKRIFDVFMQADTSTTRMHGGTGLGLPISGLLAAKMGSRIKLESEEHKGSTFYFTLEADYEVGELLAPQTLQQINRVLVVDDNENNRLILQHLFEYWGIRFTGCDRGKTALQVIKEAGPFDAIIMDYHMPEMNGLDTIKEIRKNLSIPPEKQPIILLHSSADDPAIFKQCKKLDVQFNITKPVKSQVLLQYLQNIKQYQPDHKKPKNPTKRAEQKQTDSSPGPLILIVEDVEMNLLLIKTFIKKILPGCRILEATEGKQAVDLWKSANPDLVLMDIQMPVMDGLKATAAIRQQEQEQGKKQPTPIIALTARTLKGESEHFLKSGMNDFLAKPIDRDELAKKLHKYL